VCFDIVCFFYIGCIEEKKKIRKYFEDPEVLSVCLHILTGPV